MAKLGCSATCNKINLPSGLIYKEDQEPKELPAGYSAHHTAKDALANGLTSQDPILQPLLPWQFQVQPFPGGFHPFQDVEHNDREGFGPAYKTV